MKQMQTGAISTYPNADISIRRNRLPKKGNNIYLNDGAEFEIELTNNTTSRFLTKLKLNGQYISNTGIILRPGEHIYLERYLDSNNKFKFETYKIPKTKSTEKAIVNNGLVEIEFYQEVVKRACWYYPTYTYTSSPTISPNWVTYDSGTLTGTTTNLTAFHTTTSGNIAFDDLNIRGDDKTIGIGTIPKPKKEKETGRIEQGSHSNQEFEEGTGSFNNYVDHTITYHLFPLSEKKNITVDELKSYCTGCGRKHKRGWKFCPSCGTKV